MADYKNPPLLKAATKVNSIGQKIQSKLLAPYSEKKGDGWLYVLAHNGREKAWTVLAKVQNFTIGSDSFRNRPTFEHSTLKEDFGEDENQSFGQIIFLASHVATWPQGDVYSIREGDEVQVEYLNFSYIISGTKVSDRFDPADYE